MAAIDETTKVDKLLLPKAYLRTRLQKLYDDTLESCCRRLSGREEDPLVEIPIAESKSYSFYPQLNLFMPNKEWISTKCNSSHNKSHCETESNEALALADKINQHKNISASVKALDCTRNGETFSRLLKVASDPNSDNRGAGIFREACSLQNSSVASAEAPTSFLDFLWSASNGMRISVIELDGFSWRRVKPRDSFFALLKTGLEVRDQELKPLMMEYGLLDGILPESEMGEINWDDAVTALAEDSHLAETLLQSESMRMNHQPLSAKVLTDPNQGHWDAWPVKGLKEFLAVPIQDKVYARNPLIDVDKSGVIGIDFGTKSTIVAKWSGGDAEVLRIGLDDFTKEPAPHHYENPTMMEFVDLNAFVESYAGETGRPYTSWADLKTAHEARGDLDGLSSKDVELSQAFFSGLKQWAGYGDRKVIINDTKGNAEQELVPYEELKAGDFDPIEIYAYHIGLAVNNMSGRKIVLKYLLSFPATFTLKAQRQILASFEKGIKRSLPQAVIQDATSMKSFRVEGGTSEPAAYAVCALKTLGLTPEESQSIPYAVFDFGGGTTDFDFGLWRMSTDDELDDEDVDWVIEHFGSGGDAFLGGENILEDIAYIVYVANRNVLVTKENQYPFAPPHDNAVKKDAGYETLLVDSREGRMNRYRIAEKLRPLWEENEVDGKSFDSGVLKVSLFDIAGGRAQDVELHIETDRLKAFIHKRIASCVDSFVESMQHAFAMLDKEKKKHLDCPVHIFLAGNSSKSHHVRELMEERLAAIQKSFEKVLTQEKRENVAMFRIHSPLGSAEDQSSVRSDQEDVDCSLGLGQKNEGVDFAHQPTGKTGVAFGLVESAPGRRIKVVNANKTSSGETHFRYYVGRDRRGFLVPLLNPESLGGGWVDFCAAGKAEGISYLYYTRDGRGQTGKFNVKDAFLSRIEFEPTDGRVLIRASGVAEIEWCVGTVSNDGKCHPRKNSQPKKIQLIERR